MISLNWYEVVGVIFSDFSMTKPGTIGFRSGYRLWNISNCLIRFAVITRAVTVDIELMLTSACFYRRSATAAPSGQSPSDVTGRLNRVFFLRFKSRSRRPELKNLTTRFSFYYFSFRRISELFLFIV